MVIIDTLAKLLRVKDLSDYMPVLEQVAKIGKLARAFPHVHIQALAHCKKTQTDDLFDSILGSTALRGEADTNIAIFQSGGERVIASETRIGRSIPPTILQATVVPSAGADVVKEFSLGNRFDELQAKKSAGKEAKQKDSVEDRIIAYLQGREGQTARQEAVLHDVQGNREQKWDTIQHLVECGALEMTGHAHSNTDPLRVKIKNPGLDLYRMGRRANGNDTVN